MFFDTWYGIFRVVVVGILTYLGLIIILRTTGKRTLSKMNAFDLVVTVALGSSVATTLLSKDVALLEGLSAVFTLAFLQLVAAWLATRSQAVANTLKSSPTLVVHKGAFLTSTMHSERVTKDDVLQALRGKGLTSVPEVAAVVLETDGTFSILTDLPNRQEGSTLSNVDDGGKRTA